MEQTLSALNAEVVRLQEELAVTRDILEGTRDKVTAAEQINSTLRHQLQMKDGSAMLANKERSQMAEELAKAVRELDLCTTVLEARAQDVRVLEHQKASLINDNRQLWTRAEKAEARQTELEQEISELVDDRDEWQARAGKAEEERDLYKGRLDRAAEIAARFGRVLEGE